jgi:hypothetical protein
MNSSTRVLAVFSLAAFLSALTYSCYAAGVDSLYRANNERRAESDNPSWSGYNPARTEEIWQTENMRIAREVDHTFPVFCLSFPLAISIALLIAAGAGWLPRFSFPRMIAALIPIYLAPLLVIFVCVLSRCLLLILGIALAACLLKLSVAILTSHWPRRFVLTLVICNVICSLLYVAAAGNGNRGAEPFAKGMFLIATEVIAAGLYGKSLTHPASLMPQPATAASGG